MANVLEERLNDIHEQDAEWRAKAHARLEQLTMPHWALGRLMDLAEDLAGMTRSMNPPVARKTIVTMVGDHGVAAEGVSKYPQVVTLEMVHNFVAGGAGINALARVVGARVVVVDMGTAGDLTELAQSGKILSRRIGSGTQNIARGPAMSRTDAIRCIENGMELALQLGDSTDVFGTGDMGIGNTTPSSAIVAAITGCTPLAATGRGTGIDAEQLRHKVGVVERALEVNKPEPTDGLDVLAKVGGFEIGGIAGLILGAAYLRKPVLVDGFISTAGALIAQTLSPEAADYMIAAHRSEESGHAIVLQHMKKKPLLDLGLRLGEGTGGALAMNLVDAAAAILTRVRKFDEASVSKANE